MAELLLRSFPRVLVIGTAKRLTSDGGYADATSPKDRPALRHQQSLNGFSLLMAAAD